MSFEASDLHPERSNRDLFGYELRWHRNARGLSLQALSELVNVSKSHLSRVETAESMPPEGLAERLDELFETNGIFARIYKLALREPQPLGRSPFLRLAEEAILFEEFGTIIPGLLQTPAFARAAFNCGSPYATDEQIDRMVNARIKRQDRLLQSPHACSYWFILDETALRRPVGGFRTMSDQMTSLLERAALPNVVIQTLPFHAGEYSLVGGALALITQPDHTTIAYLENSRAGTLEEDPAEVMGLLRAFNIIRAKALSPEDSLATFRSAREEYQRHATEHGS